MLDQYVYKNHKRLRMGYTTGSCAAAAAKAAAWMLLGGTLVSEVKLMTPKGIELSLEVLDPKIGPEAASCAIRKDAGDDPDVTDGLKIYASVRKTEEPGVRIDGGEGVGRVTRAGLEQPVGQRDQLSQGRNRRLFEFHGDPGGQSGGCGGEFRHRSYLRDLYSGQQGEAGGSAQTDGSGLRTPLLDRTL